MSLLDTIDGAFMNFAYGWAFSRPVRKVFYNITITALSVAVALIIGGIELLAVFADRLEPDRRHLGLVVRTSTSTSSATSSSGCSSVTWVIALAIWRFGRIEERWSARLEPGARGRRSRRVGSGSCPARSRSSSSAVAGPR